jgi:hypothetical protein
MTWTVTPCGLSDDLAPFSGMEAFPGGEVTNVRTMWMTARGHDEWVRRLHRRRACLRRPAIERLEGRDVPSAMVPLQPAHFELPDGHGRMAEVVPSMATIQDGRMTLAHSGGTGLDDQGRTARSGDGNGVAPAPAAQNNPEPADDAKHPVSQDGAPPELVDPLALVARRADHASETVVGEPPAIAQETISGLSDGAALDSVGASALGWAPIATMPVIMSVAILPGPAVGSDGRAGASAAETTPAGSVVNVVTELRVPKLVSGDAQAALDIAGDTALQLPIPVLDSNRDAPTWANLLEGTLHSDWEAVDGELRHFLAGLGGLTQHTNEHGAWPTWPLWIGAATALLLARRASYGCRRLFRRPQRALWASPRRPVPVGPWPLGPP